MSSIASGVTTAISAAAIAVAVGAGWWAIAAGAAGFAVGQYFLSYKAPSVKTTGTSTSPSSQTIRSSTSPSYTALGKVCTGGVSAFFQEQSGSQTDGEWLHLVYCLSEGAITSVESIFLDKIEFTATGEVVIPDAYSSTETTVKSGAKRTYNGYIWEAAIDMTNPIPEPSASTAYWEQGDSVSSLQNYQNYMSCEVVINPTTVNSFLLENCSQWKDTMIGQGLSYVRVSLKYNSEVFSSIPDAQFVIKGIPVYDPRTETESYSDNVALLYLWYIRNKWGIPDDEINMDVFSAAANVCDETVTNADGTTGKRYTCGLYLADNEERSTVAGAFEDACAGELLQIGGIYGLRVGAYYGPYDFTIDKDMIISKISGSTEASLADSMNTVTGTFTDPDSSWATTDYPTVQIEDWVIEDGGEISKTLSLPYVTDAYQAQRLANILLRKTRAGGQVSFTMNYMGFYCRKGRIVRLYLPDINIDGEYIVKGWSFSATEGCEVTLQAYNSDIYDDAVGVAYIPKSAITLTTGGIAAPNDLVWTPDYASETKQGVFSWTPPTAEVDYYNILINNSSDETISTAQAAGGSASCTISGLNAGSYTFKIAAKSGNARSVYATLSVNINIPPIPDAVTYTSTIDSITLIPSNSVNDTNGGTYQYYYALAEVADPLTGASFLGSGATFTHSGLQFNTTYQYYIRTKNAYGVSSAFYHLAATTSDDVSALMSALTDKITSSQLATDLKESIGSISKISSDVGTLSDTVTNLNTQITTLSGVIDTLVGALDYSETETSVSTGEIRKYNSHLYEAKGDMTSPIPIPTNTIYWTDLGEFTSITEELANVINQITELTGFMDDEAVKISSLSSIYRDNDGEGELASALNNAESSASLYEEAKTRATADEAMAQRITTAEANIDDNTASIVTEIQARTTADEALSESVVTLSAEVGENSTVISNEIQARTTADEAIGQSINVLESTVMDPTTGLSSKASAEDLTVVSATLDDVKAERVIKTVTRTDGKSVAAAIGLIADSSTDQSEIYLLGNKIAILNTLEGTPVALFQDGTTYINSALIADLTASIITCTTKLQSADEKFVIDFVNKEIRITV